MPYHISQHTATEAYAQAAKQAAEARQMAISLGIQPIPQSGERAHFVPYSCRHTFANLMKNVTGSDTDKAALMGHSDASMTKKYQSEELEKMTAITNAL